MDPFLVILILAGCGAFLTGCGKQESVNREAEINIEPDIPEEDSMEDTKSPAVSYMQLKCTSGKDAIVFMEVASGNSLQSELQAISKDTKLGDFFIKCDSSQDKKCIPDFEGNEWKCTNKDHISNGCNTVDNDSFLFCRYGLGLVYIDEDGQQEGKMNALGAFCVMDLWLMEGYNTVSKEQLAMALEDAMNYGEQSKIKNFSISPFANATKFDTSILAWTNFWNYRQAEKLGEGNFTPVRAEVIKCIMAKESSMGGPGDKNSLNDVMQSLFPGDPCFWAVTTLNPYAAGKTHIGNKNDKVLYVKNLNGQIVNGSLVLGYNVNDTKIKNWFENGSWKVYSPIIGKENMTGQEYVYNYDKVDSNMSICAGIGEYAYKLNIEYGRQTEAEGVLDYNGSEEKESYVETVESYMQEMGESLDGFKKSTGS